jgi:VIT1/CCC1 family predicted Fe2+/Mn2+ transporter
MPGQPDYWKNFSQKHTASLNLTERNAEVIFGLIMVLTFTCSLSAANEGREEVRSILFAAIGCNTAWGFVDAIMLLLAVLMERSESLKLLKKVQGSGNKDAHSAIQDVLTPLLGELISRQELEVLTQKIRQLPPAPQRSFLTLPDLKNAGLVFVLVFLSTFPVVIPFFFIEETLTALRVSNGVALALLFIFGYRLGLLAGYNKWLSGMAFAFIGSVLVWITMMLGG